MIRGRVEGLHALIGVTLRVPDRGDLSIECVIDTGFEGAITLPLAAVTALGLPFITELTANLADGTDVRTDVHVATILWAGVEQEIAVLALGQRPLVGTTLLHGHHVGIDFVDGGSVEIGPV